jgi:hypothetical protein
MTTYQIVRNGVRYFTETIDADHARALVVENVGDGEIIVTEVAAPSDTKTAPTRENPQPNEGRRSVKVVRPKIGKT